MEVDNEFKDEFQKDKKKKIIIIAIIVVVLLGIGLGSYFILKKGNNENKIDNNKVTILFHTDSEQVLNNMEIDKGNSINLPEVTKEGYNFLGWYVDDIKIDDNYKFNKTTVLNAKWEKISENDDKKEENEVKYQNTSNNYNSNLIKNVNKINNKSNYLISPYSIEIALNMLKYGADGNTYNELASVLPDRNINDLSSDKVKISNAVFIKNDYKEYIENNYINTLKNKYNAELLYDKFTTPDVINNWVNNKTDGMIKKLLDQMDKDFVLGLANAVAIDVEWQSAFECEQTKEGEFTSNNKKTKVEMMHKSYESNASYFENDDSKGIVLPYKEYNNKTLEFVGILPNNIDTYINKLDDNKLKDIKGTINASSETEINVSIPRFKYDYSLESQNFKDVLKNMGINLVFNPSKSNLEKIINKTNLKKMNAERLYVSEAIHKTHIDFFEECTKAAAATYFGVNKSMAQEQKVYKIEFNKPFIYMIRDSKTHEILFFGVVYEPNVWNGSTCVE